VPVFPPQRAKHTGEYSELFRLACFFFSDSRLYCCVVYFSRSPSEQGWHMVASDPHRADSLAGSFCRSKPHFFRTNHSDDPPEITAAPALLLSHVHLTTAGTPEYPAIQVNRLRSMFYFRFSICSELHSFCKTSYFSVLLRPSAKSYFQVVMDI